MHPTALENAKEFFITYSKDSQRPRVLELGSQDVNGTIKSVCPTHYEYIGADFEKARGVDVILDDPYDLPFPDKHFDFVVSSSCLEHSELFWLVFLELCRVAKPDGLIYLNTPSAGSFHRFPVDCWRFYPDAGLALQTWGRRNGYQIVMTESFTHIGGSWQDFVCVFLKDEAFTDSFPDRMSSNTTTKENIQTLEAPDLIKPAFVSQNERKLGVINQIATGRVNVN